MFTAIFLICNIIVVGSFAAVYGKRYKFTQGMILGVHVPENATDNEEVKTVLNSYRKKTKICFWLNGILSVLVCLLSFSYISVFIIVWSLWFIEFIVVSQVLIFWHHRKLFDIKMKNNWIMGESSKTTMIDTRVTSDSGKMQLSPLWHLPIFIVSIGISFVPNVRAYYFDGSWDGILPFGILLLTDIMFLIFHVWVGSRRNEVYSQDSDINLTLNKVYKRGMSASFLVASYLNTASFVLLICALSFSAMRKDIWFYIFIALEISTVFIFMAVYYYIRKKKNDLLSGGGKEILVDDDIYWKNGWYDNPNDKRVFIQDRMCDTNYSMNIGSTAGKVTYLATAVGTVIMLLVLSIMFLKMDFTVMDLNRNGDKVNITAGAYDTEFSMEDVESIEIVDRIPDNLSRTNGAETDSYLLGKFKGVEIGNCRLYIYRGYEPVLKVTLKDDIIFINSKDSGQVLEWMNELIGF